MRHGILTSALLCLTLVLTGCGSSPESLMKRQIDLVNELSEALENDESEEELKEIAEKLKENSEKMEELDISDEKKAELTKEYAADAMEAYTRLSKAMQGKMRRKGFPMPNMPGTSRFPGM